MTMSMGDVHYKCNTCGDVDMVHTEGMIWWSPKSQSWEFLGDVYDIQCACNSIDVDTYEED